MKPLMAPGSYWHLADRMQSSLAALVQRWDRLAVVLDLEVRIAGNTSRPEAFARAEDRDSPYANLSWTQ